MFIARGKEDALVTRNLVAGESVYGEKRISVEVRIHACIHYIVHVHMLQFIKKDQIYREATVEVKDYSTILIWGSQNCDLPQAIF